MTTRLEEFYKKEVVPALTEKFMKIVSLAPEVL